MKQMTVMATLCIAMLSAGVFVGSLWSADDSAGLKRPTIPTFQATPVYSGQVAYMVWRNTEDRTEGFTRGDTRLPGVTSTTLKHRASAAVFPEWVAVYSESGSVRQFIPRERIVDLHFE